MSTKHKVAVLIFNLVCLPINIWTFSCGWKFYQSGGEEGLFGFVCVMLATAAFVLCSATAVSLTTSLVKTKQS